MVRIILLLILSFFSLRTFAQIEGGSVDRFSWAPKIELGMVHGTSNLDRFGLHPSFGAGLLYKPNEKLFLKLSTRVQNPVKNKYLEIKNDSIIHFTDSSYQLLDIQFQIGYEVAEIGDHRLGLYGGLNYLQLYAGEGELNYPSLSAGIDFKTLFGNHMFSWELEYLNAPFNSGTDYSLKGGFISLRGTFYISPGAFWGVW